MALSLSVPARVLGPCSAAAFVMLLWFGHAQHAEASSLCKRPRLVDVMDRYPALVADELRRTRLLPVLLEMPPELRVFIGYRHHLQRRLDAVAAGLPRPGHTLLLQLKGPRSDVVPSALFRNLAERSGCTLRDVDKRLRAAVLSCLD